MDRDLNNQEKEIERANAAVEQIQIRIGQIKNDISREQFLLDDTKENLIRVRDEKSLLEKEQGDLFEEENDDLEIPAFLRRQKN